MAPVKVRFRDLPHRTFAAVLCGTRWGYIGLHPVKIYQVRLTTGGLAEVRADELVIDAHAGCVPQENPYDAE